MYNLLLYVRSNFLVLIIHVVLQWVEKGKGKWVRILYVHIRVASCPNETKKGSETSNLKSKILRILKIEMANMQRRQDRDGLVMMTR